MNGQAQSDRETSSTDSPQPDELSPYADDYYFDENPFSKNSTNVKGVEVNDCRLTTKAATGRTVPRPDL